MSTGLASPKGIFRPILFSSPLSRATIVYHQPNPTTSVCHPVSLHFIAARADFASSSPPLACWLAFLCALLLFATGAPLLFAPGALLLFVACAPLLFAPGALLSFVVSSPPLYALDFAAWPGRGPSQCGSRIFGKDATKYSSVGAPALRSCAPWQTTRSAVRVLLWDAAARWRETIDAAPRCQSMA